VFAEVAVTAGVHGVFVPIEIEAIENADDSITAGQIIGWGGDRARIAQLTFAGESEDGKVGFKTQINVNESYAEWDVVDSAGNIVYAGINHPITLDDWAGVWIKPIDQLRFTLGRFQQDDIRGKIGANDGWGLAVLGEPTGEDAIFSRFTGNIGALLDIYPVTGLGVHFLIPGLGTTSYASGSLQGTKAYEVYERFQLALSYELSGIGLARVQYLNSTADHVNNRDSNGRRVEAAFAVTAIEGLTIDIGVKIPFRYRITTNGELNAYSQKADVQNVIYGINQFTGGTLGWSDVRAFALQPFQASVGVSGAFGNFGIWGRIDTFFLGNTRVEVPGVVDYAKTPTPFTVRFAIEPTYDFGVGVVGLMYSFSAASDTKTKIKYDGTIAPYAAGLGMPDSVENGGGGMHGLGASFKIPIGGGSLKPGVAYKFGHDKVYGYYGKRNGIFSIPIEFDFSF
jgi:hypothetical protein